MLAPLFEARRDSASGSAPDFSCTMTAVFCGGAAAAGVAAPSRPTPVVSTSAANAARHAVRALPPVTLLVILNLTRSCICWACHPLRVRCGRRPPVVVQVLPAIGSHRSVAPWVVFLTGGEG